MSEWNISPWLYALDFVLETSVADFAVVDILFNASKQGGLHSALHGLQWRGDKNPYKFSI
jgi:hypothetical protein